MINLCERRVRLETLMLGFDTLSFFSNVIVIKTDSEFQIFYRIGQNYVLLKFELPRRQKIVLSTIVSSDSNNAQECHQQKTL